MNWVWLVPTASEAASGGNGTALWACLISSLAMLCLSWSTRNRSVGYVRDVLGGYGSTYTYLVIGLSLGLFALRAGLWEPFYISRASGHVEWAAWYSALLRGPAAALTAATAVVALLHIRYLLQPRFGRRWLVPIVVIIATTFVVHAFLPRIL